MKVVAIAGTSGSGKDCAGEYVCAAYGGMKCTLSDIVRQRIGRSATPGTLRRYADELRMTEGHDILARLAYQSLKQQNAQLGVIVSVRHPAEAKFLIGKIHKHGGAFLWMDADRQTRYEHNQARDAMTFEQFCAEEETQMGGKDNHLNLAGVRDLAQSRITNNYAGKELLYRQLDDILALCGLSKIT